MKPSKKKIAQIFQLSPGSVIEIKPNGKYLLILPEAVELKHLQPALLQFFGSAKVLAIAVKDLNQVKIAELLEENK